jgi:hypothetical protein
MVMNFERGLLRHIGVASTAIGVLVYAALPAQADGNILSPITNFVAAPFGGGKKVAAPADDHNSVIDYRPRPALVVPPNTDLPPPHPSVVRSADWPKDPDGPALRRAKADSRRLAPLSDSKLDDDSADSGADSAPPPEQTAAMPSNCTMIGGMPICVATPWGKVDLPGGGGKAENAKGDVHLSSKPTRQYLTDPPVAYLAPVQITEADQKEAKAAAKSETKCLIPTPGWFGCPSSNQ